LFASALPAQQTVLTQCVNFARGVPVKTFMGSVDANSTVVYIVNASAGEVLNLSLIRPTPATRVALFAPGADTAMFVVPNDDATVSTPLSMSGDYTIKVFLAPNAARPREVAAYALSIRVTDAIVATRVAP
jgi:hypothetical protein